MRTRRLLWLALCVIALLLVTSWGITGALEYGWARRSLLARLSQSFGRPVEAGRFSFSLMSGPQLQVDSIAVAEDPRFGQEYFLRADQLTVGLLWGALLRGRVEFGTLSLTHPSLNLVHTRDGHWNVESWLPPAIDSSGANAQATSATDAVADPGRLPPRPIARHLGRIEIEGGRINFKLGQEKLLFALEDVNGELNQDEAGRWSLDLEAIPMRASISLQQAGTLRLRGTVAGTSARLRPASLNLNWEDASLADVLRLASGQDYSVRGEFGAEFSATIKDKSDKPEATNVSAVTPAVTPAGGDWNIAGTLRLAGIHRWDLPARATNPAVNVTVAAAWSPGAPQLQVARCVLESAHSRLLAGGTIDWSHGFYPSAQVVSSSLDLGDLLAWRQAFRSDLQDDLAMDGTITLQGALAAWPPHIQQASIASAGADVHTPTLTSPIHVGAISATLKRDLLVLDPVAVSLPNLPSAPTKARLPNGRTSGAPSDNIVTDVASSVGTLRVDGALGPFRAGVMPLDWNYRVAVSGQTQRSQDLTQIVATLGRAASNDWTATGPAAFQLAWGGTLRHADPSPTGTLSLDGVQVITALLNKPLLLSSVSIELRAGQRHVKLADAQAFGTHWKGTLDQLTPRGMWHFDLSAARLDIADLDLWLGPRARPGFLARLLPFTSSGGAPQAPSAILRGMATSGRLRIAQLALDPLHAEKLDADIELNGQNLVVRRAQADFFDGRVTGDFEAQVSASPAYSFHGQFERVNLAALALATSSLEGRLAGMAAGEISLSARGIGREQLLASLSGAGKLQVRDALVRGIDLLNGTVAVDARAADTRLSEGRVGETRTIDARAADVTKPANIKSAAESRFTSAASTFHVGGGLVQIERLSLATREERFEIAGSVSLARQLDLRVWSLGRGVETVPDTNLTADREEWTIAGTLEAPLLTRQTHIAGSTDAIPGTANGFAPAGTPPESIPAATAAPAAGRR
jgi:hypothetical protein